MSQFETNNGFRRLHTLPKSYWKHCRGLWEIPPRARYIKDQSYRRWVAHPENSELVESLERCRDTGEMGTISNFRIITTADIANIKKEQGYSEGL